MRVNTLTDSVAKQAHIFNYLYNINNILGGIFFKKKREKDKK